MNFLATLLEWLSQWWPFAKVDSWEKGIRQTFIPALPKIKFDRNWKNSFRRTPIEWTEPRVAIVDIGPGWHRRIPWMESIHELSVVEQVYELETQSITTTDNRSATFKCNVIYELTNIRKVITEVHDFEGSMKGMIEIHMARTTRGKSWEELHLQQSDIELSLKEALKAPSRRWGAKILDVGLTTLVQAKPIRLFQTTT